MAQYTFLESDTGSTLLGGLNDNFDELYANKIENDSTDTLTNKSIDADNNTITNLGTDEFASASKTGLDTKVVTGTKGTSGNLAKWNADGDLVDAEVAIETSLTDSATKVPTSSAIKDYVESVLETKSLFIPVASSYSATATTLLGAYVVRVLTDTGSVNFTFKIPDNYTSFTSMKMYMIPDTTETIQWDIIGYQSASGETYTTLTATDTNVTLGVTQNLLTKADIGASTNMATFLGGLQAGDTLTIQFESDTPNIVVVGLEFNYA